MNPTGTGPAGNRATDNATWHGPPTDQQNTLSTPQSDLIAKYFNIKNGSPATSGSTNAKRQKLDHSVSNSLPASSNSLVGFETPHGVANDMSATSSQVVDAGKDACPSRSMSTPPSILERRTVLGLNNIEQSPATAGLKSESKNPSTPANPLSTLSSMTQRALSSTRSNLFNVAQSYQENVDSRNSIAIASSASSATNSLVENEVDKDDLEFLAHAFEQTMQAVGAEKMATEPPFLRCKLMKHQKIGLEWMKNREFKKPRGGILADDMGLGKTIQTIALCLSNMPPPVSPDHRDRLRTLIVTPASLLVQWKEEIERHSKLTLKVEIHHGQQRSQDPNWLCTCDIVLTTYGTVQSECFILDDLGNEVKAPGPLFHIKWFRIVLDEASAIKNRNSNNAKAITKLKAKRRWCLTGTPIQNSLDDLISLFKFLRYVPYDDYGHFHKTFCTVAGRGSRKKYKLSENGKKKLQVCLGAICLRRRQDSLLDGKPIVELPEAAHDLALDNFTSEESDYYKALETASQLKFSRFVKAGTVVKNYATSLMLLLRLRQACDHPLLCLEESAKALMMQSADASIIASYNHPDRNRDDEDEDDDDAELLDTSRPVQPKVKSKMPEIDVEALLVVDLKRELRLRGLDANGLKATLKKRLKAALEKENDADNQLSNPKLAVFSPQIRDRIAAGDFNSECPVCLDVIVRSGSVVTPCGHVYCKACIESYISTGQHQCPICRNPVTSDSLIAAAGILKQPAVEYDDDDTEDQPDVEDKDPEIPFERMTYRSKIAFLEKKMDASRAHFAGMPASTKISKVLRLLSIDREEDDETKSLIFSQWTSMLDLIEPMLEQERFKFVRYDGSLNQQHREEVIEKFVNDSDTTVMLCSLKAAAYGLNLTVASRVYLVDPWWNPSVEEQAIGRAYRIGQQRHVRIHHLAIEGTVEERILELQKKKKQLSRDALGEDGKKGIDQSIGKLGIADLRALFNVDAAGNLL